MNCCKPEQLGTKEHGKMFKRIQVFEDGRILGNEARMKDKKEGLQGKNTGDCGLSSEGEDSWHRKVLQDRSTLLQKEGDIVREYKALHEENFLINWLREDVESTEERRKRREEKVREQENRSGERMVEREEEKTVGVRRRCVDFFLQ